MSASSQVIDLGSLVAIGAGTAVALASRPSIGGARVFIFGTFVGTVQLEVSPDKSEYFDAVDDAGDALNAVALTATDALTVALTEAGGIGTVTTDAAHGMKVGDTMQLAGQTPAGWAGDYVILSVPTPTTATFTKSTEADSTVDGTWLNLSQRFSKTLKGDAVSIRANVTVYVSGTIEVRVVPDSGYRFRRA